MPLAAVTLSPKFCHTRPCDCRMLSTCWCEQFSFGIGNLFFPLSYLFGDILTKLLARLEMAETVL
jgi:hypothetical protein